MQDNKLLLFCLILNSYNAFVMVHKTCFFASEGYDTRFQPVAITAELHLILKQFSALTAFILTFIWFDYWLICFVFV